MNFPQSAKIVQMRMHNTLSALLSADFPWISRRIVHGMSAGLSGGHLFLQAYQAIFWTCPQDFRRIFQRILCGLSAGLSAGFSGGRHEKSGVAFATPLLRFRFVWAFARRAHSCLSFSSSRISDGFITSAEQPLFMPASMKPASLVAMYSAPPRSAQAARTASS